MEPQIQMDIARWAGVTAVGNPEWPFGLLVLGEPPADSFIVVKTPDERYVELYNNAGVLTPRPIAPLWTPGREPQVGVFGKSVNSCLWVRGLGETKCTFVDAGIYKTFGVTNAGAVGALGFPPFDQKATNQTLMGGALEGPTRVTIDSAPGTPSGFILQSPNGTPWVIWVNVATTLRVTDFATFRVGV